jgi:RND family efflux transporter MFP subunit
MKKLAFAVCALIPVVLAGCEPASPAAQTPGAAPPPGPAGLLDVPGRTRAMLSRRGIIAAAILRPVVEVLVSPGDRVTKGQVLIKLYDLEAQAKVRARENELKSAEAKAEASRRNLELAEKGRQTGSFPQVTYNELRGAAGSNDALVQAAQAELSLAQSELKLYNVTASIDGEIAWLDVSPGTVTWPGAMIWGEIVDLRELDIRCEVSPAQAELVTVGDAAEIRLDANAEPVGTGKVVFLGKMADRSTGLVPVVVRVANDPERLRAEVPVKVRFQRARGN